MRRLLALSICLLVRPPALLAEVPAGRPEIWMVPPALPDGHCLRELFTRPDQWKHTRSRITVLGCFDHFLNKQYKDEELRAWLPMIDKWGLKFALEVGAVKPWGTTGKAVFEAERPMWDRFQSLGGRIYAMAMDEPLFCVRNDLKKSAEYAVEETAQFVALVRAHYPDVRIGDIEPYPAIPLPELIGWIDALQARLKQMNVPGLDFFRLDVDWVHFTVGQRGNWQEVRGVEEACRARKIPFSLIYWAADYGALERLGLADDATWYISVMRQGNDYALIGGAPDEYVIESWIPAPLCCLPDAAGWTFTRSVRDFCDRFVRPKVSARGSSLGGEPQRTGPATLPRTAP